jgi:hypothetical protein
LAALLEMEQVKPADLNAIANLTRAAIAQQRWAAEQKERDQQQHPPAAEPQGALQQPQALNPRPASASQEAPATGSDVTDAADHHDAPPVA